jgi:hypothetical protein
VNANENSTESKKLITLGIVDNIRNHVCRMYPVSSFLKASPIVPADQVSHDGDRTYRISKDKLGLLITAIKSSREFCSVTFDKNGLLVGVQSDKAFDGN